MKVSVIIPTYNEGEDIINCIESLGRQTYLDFEIIVVDDGSSDLTYKRLSNLKKILKNFILLRQHHKGAGSARNLGAKYARGEILVFVDADMTFDRNFIGELVKPIVDGNVKGVFSKNEFVANWSNSLARCWNINEGWEDRKRHPKNYPSEQKVFRAILKSEFERVGGFTPGGYTDDYSLAEKLGYSAKAVNGAVFYHKNPDNLKEIYLQARWAAKRRFKFGLLGFLIGLVRVSFPFSIIFGLAKSIYHHEPSFIIFKIVYDMGFFLGIFEYLFKGKVSK